MAVETFALIQGYLTALILVLAAFLWYKSRNEYQVERLKSHRIFNIILLLSLPFIMRIVRFIPERANLFMYSLLLTLVCFALTAQIIKSYRKNVEERTEDLRELLERSKKHPIRLEFARKIVAPEYTKLTEEKIKIQKERNSVDVREKRLDTQEKIVNEKLKKIRE